MNKKQLNEKEICKKYITPAIEQSGWELNKNYKMEFKITDGRIVVRNNKYVRERGMRADYYLYNNHIPIAIIEAKDNKHTMGFGMQQGTKYASKLKCMFVYSSNGDGFIEWNSETGETKELTLEQFPTPNELWNRYLFHKGLNKEEEGIIKTQYYYNPNTSNPKTPRYYQTNAINSVIENVARGKKRLLLVMATGTGKTFTAMQLIHILRKSKKVKKVLFLADRNILVDQTRDQDFSPFKKVMTKIENRKIDTSYEIYLSLYQQLVGSEEKDKIFKTIAPDFFDLIIIDECHRGSANEDSQWREVLEYFSSSIQIGLTATPKECDGISNSKYFGEPIYTYSLKEGIEDGFLAPFINHRYIFDKDCGYRPEKEKRDKYGNLITDKYYDTHNFDKELILEQRINLVAKEISNFLKQNDRFMKTIVFCEDIEHAERMRLALIKENLDLYNESEQKYIARITGDVVDKDILLDNFINVDEVYPTIVTTSKLLSTGVDTKTCKVIAIDKYISSMIEFKQLVGRGTRIREDKDKLFFNILDFRQATKLFSDEEFDGPALPTISSNEEFKGEVGKLTFEERNEIEKIKFVVDDVEVKLIDKNIEYYDSNGDLVTETFVDYCKERILNKYPTYNEFLDFWISYVNKEEVFEELKDEGVYIEFLREYYNDIEDFEIIGRVAYEFNNLSRNDRKNIILNKYMSLSEKQQKVLNVLLDFYIEDGVNQLDAFRLLTIDYMKEIDIHRNILKEFGGKIKYKLFIKNLLFDMFKGAI